MTSERTEPPSVETLQEARRAIEAVLLVATDPTPVQLLAQLVELPADVVDAMCRELADEYETDRRGFQLVQVAGGWRYQTHPDTHPYVERYAMEGIPNRLSSAALETLAIVAYKQPISRGQIGAIRGVNVDGVLRTLLQRGYVTELGKDDGPGQATLFGTTDFFLEQVGLMSTADLPPLGDFVPSVEVLEALEQTLKIDGDPPVEVGSPAEVEAKAVGPAPAEKTAEDTAEDPDAGPESDEEPEVAIAAGSAEPAAEEPADDNTDDNTEQPVEAVGPDDRDIPLATVQPTVNLAHHDPTPAAEGPDEPDGPDAPDGPRGVEVGEDGSVDLEPDVDVGPDVDVEPDVEASAEEPDPPPDVPPDEGAPPAADIDDRGRSLEPGSPEPDDVVEQSAWQTGSTEPERRGGEESARPLDLTDPEIPADEDGTNPRLGGAHRLDGLAAKFRSSKAVTNGSTDHHPGPEDV